MAILLSATIILWVGSRPAQLLFHAAQERMTGQNLPETCRYSLCCSRLVGRIPRISLSQSNEGIVISGLKGLNWKLSHGSWTKIGRRLSTLELLEPCYWFLVILAVLALMRITGSLFVAFFATKIASPLKNSLTLLVTYKDSILQLSSLTVLLGLKLGATGLIGAERPLLLVTI